MISIENLKLNYGSKVIFDEVSAYIGNKDRIGLVGSNGAGKTTLLKVLLGIKEVEEGKIGWATGTNKGYLPQDGIYTQGKSLYEEASQAFEDVKSLEAKIEASNREVDEMDTSSEEYLEELERIAMWEERLNDLEAHKIKSKTERVLLGLGFKMEDMGRDCGEFSGGWQMRIALAKLLLKTPSLLLLDEPTNHLDITSQRWLEKYLNRYEGSLIIISHDRSFLDALCTRTFELSMGKLTVYEGNYSYFVKESAKRKELLLKAYQSQKKEIEKTEQFINRFRAKSSKAKQVQSRIKALEKVDRIELEREESSVGFSFPQASPSGHTVLHLKGVTQTYPKKQVFNGLDFKLERGDRVAIVGVNGAGKSTLVKLLAGILEPTSGERTVGHNARVSYFAQDHAESLDQEKTILETIEDATTTDIGMAHRSLLGAFLFRGDEVFKSVKVLSGGEKCRLALACLLVQKANCLILDEPTNHLDMKSQERLQEALKSYGGTVLIVSHNRSFMDPLVNKVVEVKDGALRTFLGNISYYLEIVEEESLRALSERTEKDEKARKYEGLSQKERNKLKNEEQRKRNELNKQIKQLDEQINAWEREKKELEVKMQSPDFFKSDEAQSSMGAYQALEKKVEQAYKQWEQLQGELEVL